MTGAPIKAPAPYAASRMPIHRWRSSARTEAVQAKVNGRTGMIRPVVIGQQGLSPGFFFFLETGTISVCIRKDGKIDGCADQRFRRSELLPIGSYRGHYCLRHLPCAAESEDVDTFSDLTLM